MTSKTSSHTPGTAIVRVYQADGQFVREFETRKGLNLWYLLRREGLPIGSSCTGVGVCGACAVRVKELDSSQHSHLEPPGSFEDRTRIQNNIPETFRIACLVRVFGDLEVTLRP